MNTKTYKVLRTILENPNSWQSITALAHDVDLTQRQIVAITCAYGHLPLKKDRDNVLNRSYVMFEGTDKEAEEALDQVTSEYYNISDEMKRTVYNSLSSVAWMSVSDVMDDTHYNRCDVARTLGLLEGVTTKTSGVLMLYKRNPPEVS